MSFSDTRSTRLPSRWNSRRPFDRAGVPTLARDAGGACKDARSGNDALTFTYPMAVLRFLAGAMLLALVTLPARAVEIATWTNIPFTPQTETFTAAFAATPSASDEDTVIGLSQLPATALSDLAAAIRFNDVGHIDASNYGGWTASATVFYSRGTTYYVRIVVNLANHTYSVYLTRSGAREITLARNYGLKHGRGSVTSLAYMAEGAGSGGGVSGNAPVTHLTIVRQSNASCPFASAGYGDGCDAGAGGTPQHPRLLAGYKVRPPWDVAGVDYAVGVPVGTALTSWQTLNGNPNLQITGSQIACISGSVTLNEIDFSAAGGGYLYIPHGGCTSLTIANSRWACPTAVWPSYWLIQDQNQAALSVTYSSFDGTGCGGNLYAWIQGFNIRFEYNYSVSAPVQIMQATAPGSVIYRYNMIDDNLTVPPNHSNDQEWNSTGTIASDFVEFNTVYQHAPACNEAFQFYNNNNVGSAIHSPTLKNNTIIALPATLTNNCGAGNPSVIMSYLIHGTSNGYPTAVTGTALNEFNYFDWRGAYGAYYTGSMQGWVSDGNVDMNTGHTVTPQ